MQGDWGHFMRSWNVGPFHAFRMFGDVGPFKIVQGTFGILWCVQDHVPKLLSHPDTTFQRVLLGELLRVIPQNIKFTIKSKL